MADRSNWKNVPQDRFDRRAAYMKESVGKLSTGDASAFGADVQPAPSGKKLPAPAKSPAAPAKKAMPSSGGKAPSASPASKPASKGADPLASLESQMLAEEHLGQMERYVATPGKGKGKGKGGYVPPQAVGLTRGLAKQAEEEGGTDWNSRLGAPQYRTQSDNLAAPEATCNVTSMAMVLERLGYGRADVLAALDREVKVRWLKSKGKKAEGVDLSTVELPEGRWGEEVLGYLDKQQAAGKAYQRLRGRDTAKGERGKMAAAYAKDAQMEDLIDMLLSLLGVDRTATTPSAAKLLARVETTAAERPAVETLRKGGANTWDVVRARVQATLESGGSAMMSIFHSMPLVPPVARSYPMAGVRWARRIPTGAGRPSQPRRAPWEDSRRGACLAFEGSC